MQGRRKALLCGKLLMMQAGYYSSHVPAHFMLVASFHCVATPRAKSGEVSNAQAVGQSSDLEHKQGVKRKAWLTLM